MVYLSPSSTVISPNAARFRLDDLDSPWFADLPPSRPHSPLNFDKRQPLGTASNVTVLSTDLFCDPSEQASSRPPSAGTKPQRSLKLTVGDSSNNNNNTTTRRTSAIMEQCTVQSNTAAVNVKSCLSDASTTAKDSAGLAPELVQLKKAHRKSTGDSTTHPTVSPWQFTSMQQKLDVMHGTEPIHDSHVLLLPTTAAPKPATDMNATATELVTVMSQLERRRSYNRNSRSPLRSSSSSSSASASTAEVQRVTEEEEERTRAQLPSPVTLRRQKRTRTRRAESRRRKSMSALPTTSPMSPPLPLDEAVPALATDNDKQEPATAAGASIRVPPKLKISPRKESWREVFTAEDLRPKSAPLSPTLPRLLEFVTSIMTPRSPRKAGKQRVFEIPAELHMPSPVHTRSSGSSDSGRRQSVQDPLLHNSQQRVLRNIQATTQRKLTMPARAIHQQVLMSNLVLSIMEWENRDAAEMQAEKKRAARRRHRETGKATKLKRRSLNAQQQQPQQLAGVVLQKTGGAVPLTSTVTPEATAVDLLRRHLTDDEDDGVLTARRIRREEEEEQVDIPARLGGSLSADEASGSVSSTDDEGGDNDDDDERPLGLMLRKMNI